MDDRTLPFVVVIVMVTISPGALSGVSAAPQDQPASQQSANTTDTTENNGQDFTRPETLLQLRYLYQDKAGHRRGPGDHA